MNTESKPVSIFIAYSNKDLVFKEEIRKHLRPLQRIGRVEIWDNYNIEAGANWDSVIRDKLRQADIILLLLSPDALDSDYFYDVEAPLAISRHQSGEAIAVGVMLRPCELKYTPFGDLTKYELLPKKGYPVVDPRWHNTDEAYLTILKEIDLLVEKLEEHRVKFNRASTVASSQALANAIDGAKIKIMRLEEEYAGLNTKLESLNNSGGKKVFDVILVDAGYNKLTVVKEVKNLLLIGLPEAKSFVDNAPNLLKRSISKEEAELIKSTFQEIGAVIEIR